MACRWTERMVCEVDTRTLLTGQPHLLPFLPGLLLEFCASVILHVFPRWAVPSLICLPSSCPCLVNSSSTCAFELQASICKFFLTPFLIHFLSFGSKFSYTPLVVLSHVWLLWPHGQQPTRLLCPWDFPGKNTGVGFHFLLPECKSSLRNKTIVQYHFTLRVWNIADIVNVC